MSVTKEELDRFHDFAISLVSESHSELTWAQLFESWRLQDPPSDERGENIAAIREALQAMDAGRMRPFSSFDAEFRERHQIASDR